MTIHPILRGGLIVGLLFVFVWMLLRENAASVYKSPEVEAQFTAIYDEKMRELPEQVKEIVMNFFAGE